MTKNREINVSLPKIKQVILDKLKDKEKRKKADKKYKEDLAKEE